MGNLKNWPKIVIQFCFPSPITASPSPTLPLHPYPPPDPSLWTPGFTYIVLHLLQFWRNFLLLYHTLTWCIMTLVILHSFWQHLYEARNFCSSTETRLVSTVGAARYTEDGRLPHGTFAHHWQIRRQHQECHGRDRMPRTLSGLESQQWHDHRQVQSGWSNWGSAPSWVLCCRKRLILLCCSASFHCALMPRHWRLGPSHLWISGARQYIKICAVEATQRHLVNAMTSTAYSVQPASLQSTIIGNCPTVQCPCCVLAKWYKFVQVQWLRFRPSGLKKKLGYRPKISCLKYINPVIRTIGFRVRVRASAWVIRVLNETKTITFLQKLN